MLLIVIQLIVLRDVWIAVLKIGNFYKLMLFSLFVTSAVLVTGSVELSSVELIAI